MDKDEIVAWLALLTAVINLTATILNIKNRKSGSSKKKNRRRK